MSLEIGPFPAGTELVFRIEFADDSWVTGQTSNLSVVQSEDSWYLCAQKNIVSSGYKRWIRDVATRNQILRIGTGVTGISESIAKRQCPETQASGVEGQVSYFKFAHDLTQNQLSLSTVLLFSGMDFPFPFVEGEEVKGMKVLLRVEKDGDGNGEKEVYEFFGLADTVGVRELGEDYYMPPSTAR
jgi:hypothetical protein